MSSVTFITGNPEKATRFSRHIGMKITHAAVELDEIQTLDHRELVEHKVRQAYQHLGRPVLIEDVFFTFEAWDRLPGPFVKFFVESSVEMMCRALDGFDNRRARAACMFGYFDGKTLAFFEGGIDGKVANTPRGETGYGFDRIFEPDGFDGKTAGELSEDVYDKYYMVVKPFHEVAEFLKTRGGNYQ